MALLMPWVTLVCLIFGLVIFGLLVLFFSLEMRQSYKDREVKRRIALRYHPDPRGNYPQDLLPTGEVTNFTPGNSSYPSNPYYIVQPHKTEVIAALPPRPEAVQSVYGKEVEATSQPEALQSQAEVIAYLVDAKARGVSQTAALKSLGITGGESYTKYAAHWKRLPKKEGGS